MLTPLNIQVAIIKAFYALAIKSVKYYTGLAFGKNNTCLFKEIRLLRVYIEILKNFKIVGSTINCCCSVEGDYTVLLNTDLPLTVANIQFGCNNQGYMVFNNIGYSFTYWYDNNNNRIVIQFISDLPNPNRITNPNFVTTLDSWSYLEFEWSGYAGIGSAKYTGGLEDGFLIQSDVLEIGKTYTVSFDILTEYFGGINNNTIKVIAGTQEAVIFQGGISSTEIIPVSTTVTCFGNIGFKINVISNVDTNVNTFYLHITNVDVREVLNTTITIEEVAFTEECNITGFADSPIEVAVIESITNLPVTVDNIYGTWDGSITIATGGNVAFTFPIPVAIIDDPIAIVQAWAADSQTTDWVLLYNDGHFVLYSPFNNVNYSAYTAYFNQYEGGTNSIINSTTFIPQNFVPTGTRASAIVDIPNTFIGGVAATSIINTTIPPIDAFVTVPTQASTIVEIPTDIFSYLGTKASIQFTATDAFFKCPINTNYIYTPAANNNWYIEPRAATLSFANIEEIITYINDNSAFGYPLSLVSTSVITYPSIVDASLISPFFIYTTYTAGDSVQVELGSTYYNSSTPIGSYTVLLGDDNAAIIAGLIADIIAQGIFTGTVTTDVDNYLYFTAPVGTGSDWNSLYYTNITTSTGHAWLIYFNGGNNLTENEYTLAVTAPTEGSIYNTYSSYTTFGSNNSGNSFLSGGDDPSQALPVEIIDTLDGQLYFTATNTFTSIDDFIVAFNGFAATQATNIGINGIYTQIEFKPPLTDTYNFIYNNENLEFYFNSNIVNFGTYANGNDTTECTYSLKLYTPLDVLSGTIENLTPTNYTSLDNLVLNIQNNIANTYVFGFSVNTNNDIATTFPYPFVPPQSLVCSTYNFYEFYLDIAYTSIQYNPYTSNVSPINGGIDGYSEAFEISDTVNNIIFSKSQNTYNYPNGSEVKDGLIPDFNTNLLLYKAEWLGDGPDTAETRAIVSNFFLTQLTATGITNGNEINAFIDNIYIGKYQAPATGALPTYSTMITLLNSDIVSSNIVPGLISLAVGSGIVQQSPPGFGGSYNGKLLKIYKKLATPASIVLTFSGTAPAITNFTFSINGLIIGSYSNSIPASGSVVANNLVISINALTSTTGITATAIGAALTIIAPPLTGGQYNSTALKFDLYGGNIIINGFTYYVVYNLHNYTIGTFSGGAGPQSNLIKQAAFAGGVAPRTTTKVRFLSPTQPTSAPEYGTGNWAFNVEDLTYDYNSGEYLIDSTYSDGIDPTVGQLTVDILDNTLAVYENLYNDITPQNYLSRQALVNTFNATNPFPLNFQISLFQGSPIAGFLSPPTSFDYFNTHKFRYSYNYVSPQYTDYVDVTTTFIDGVDPVLTSYLGEFVEGNIGPFITDNPCTPTVVTQTCLTNSQISKVIQHIDKLVK